MPTESRLTPPQQQAEALGEALASLRDRSGMTQEQAAGKLGISRQAWQNYEKGVRAAILRTDLQDRVAGALGLTRGDLIRERDRLAGIMTSPPAPTHAHESATIFDLPVTGRVRMSPAGPQLYAVEEPESYFDASWMFGGGGRTLRVAGDNMTGYVESGQLVIYDVSVWPSRGEGCVIELTSGVIHVAEYVESRDGMVRARQRSPDEILSFPLAEVKGVYQVRFRGA